ncbi:hypothetical protein UYO_3115, partial [Lachnospiraceae bacterium JC7]
MLKEGYIDLVYIISFFFDEIPYYDILLA